MSQQLTPPANASVIVNPASITWKNFVDLQNDVLPWLQIPSVDTSRLTQLQLVTDFVCQQSQQLTGSPIAPTPFFGRFDGASGWNGAYIMLDYFPVLGVQEVAEWWGTSGPNYLSESTPDYQVDGFVLDAPTGMLTRIFPGNEQRPWFPGCRSIEISWTAGYNPVPALFKLPALEIIKEWWTETQQQGTGSTSADWEGTITPSGDTYPGLPTRVKAVFGATAHIGIA